MKKQIVIFSVTMMSILFLSSCFSSEDTNLSSETSTPAPEVAQTATQIGPVVLGPGFMEYDVDAIGEVKNTVLFFHQESCSTCKTTEADLIENGLPIDTQVLKIDIDADSSTDLKQKYGVTMKHTFVQVDANGEMVKKWNGSLSGQDIVDQINSSEDKMMEKSEDEAMMEKDEEKMEDTETASEVSVETTTELAGMYTDYSEDKLGENDTTIIAFFAGWCPSCVAADKAISAGVVPNGLSILKADYDSATDLRKEYGVTSQHTFVQVDSDGTMIKKWVGGTTIEDIVEKI